MKPRQFTDRFAAVPVSQQIEHAPADRGGLEHASVEEDRRGRQEFRRRPSPHQGAQGFAGAHVGQTTAEKTGEMLADDRVGGVGQAEFPQADAPALARQIGHVGAREEAVDHDLFEGGAIELRRYGSGEQAGTARRNGDGQFGRRVVVEHRHLGFAGGVHHGEELPVADRHALRLELRAQGVGERQIHVVAAEEDVFADADALQRQLAVPLGDGDEAEVGGAAADVADQDDVARRDLATPLLSRLRGPRVERRQRLLEQDDLAEAGGLRRLGGQVSRHLVERGGHGQDDLAVGQVPLPASRALGVEEPVLDVLEVAAGAVESRNFLPDVRLPRERPLPGIDMRVRQPRLGRGDQAIGYERAVVAGEMADDRPVVCAARPGQGKGVLGEFVGMRDVHRRGQRRLLADLVRSENLRDFDDLGPIVVEIGDGARAVAGAQIDAEAEAVVHEERSYRCCRGVSPDRPAGGAEIGIVAAVGTDRRLWLRAGRRRRPGRSIPPI